MDQSEGNPLAAQAPSKLRLDGTLWSTGRRILFRARRLVDYLCRGPLRGPTDFGWVLPIAAVPQMEFIAYILADDRFAPTKYVDLDFDYSRVSWLDYSEMTTDYELLLAEEVQLEGGQAWNTEFAGPVKEVFGSLSDPVAEALDHGAYLTRFRTFIDPEDMTVDPAWQLNGRLPDVSRTHHMGGWDSGDTALAARAPWLGTLVLLASVFMLRRKD